MFYLGTILTPIAHLLKHCRNAAHSLCLIGNMKPPRCHGVVGIPLCGRLEPLRLPQTMADHTQMSSRHLSRVFLAQRAGCSIAWISKRLRFSTRFFRLRNNPRIEFGKVIKSEVHLPTNLQKRWQRIVGMIRETYGDIRDSARIECNVLPDPPVSSGGSSFQYPLSIHQVDSRAINLELGEVFLVRTDFVL